MIAPADPKGRRSSVIPVLVNTIKGATIADVRVSGRLGRGGKPRDDLLDLSRRRRLAGAQELSCRRAALRGLLRNASPVQSHPIAGQRTLSGLHFGTEPFDRRARAALAMRDGECLERHLHDAERAEHHRRVDVAHVRDAEAAAGEIT